MNDNVQTRVTGIFEKLNNIQNQVQDEKNSRFTIIAQLIAQFESNLRNASSQKEAIFSQLPNKFKKLQVFLESENDILIIFQIAYFQNLYLDQKNIQIQQITISTINLKIRRVRQEQETQKMSVDLERHAKRLLQTSQKERVDQEKKLTYAISQQIDFISQDVNRQGVELLESNKYVDMYLNEDLPKIADDLQNETDERREVEERIYHQFMEQISDLRELFDRERKERETKEEDIVESLREVQFRITELLKRNRKERETTEQEMVSLFETVIEKIKIEMLEMNM